MQATDFEDARSEFEQLLADIGAGSAPGAMADTQAAGLNIVCIKGYGSRMDEQKEPFEQQTLEISLSVCESPFDESSAARAGVQARVNEMEVTEESLLARQQQDAKSHRERKRRREHLAGEW